MTKEMGKSAEIHNRLDHPVIDSDGHWLEYAPVYLEYLKAEGGEKLLERYREVSTPFGAVSRSTFEYRRDRRIPQPPWWGIPSQSSLDRATAMLPRLLYNRLDELGLDFVVLYPSGPGLFAAFLRDDEVRRAASRAFNTFLADTFKEFSDRITPAAAIPMHTPQEAIAELEHVKRLGLKAVMLESLVRRPTPAVARELPKANRYAIWYDTLAMDSDYDYDPVWAKCQELGFSPTFHTGSQGIGFRGSITNWVYNHIGHFATAGDTMCKALFLGGVTRRFPKLKFAFMEGGVSWGCRLYSDLIAHWKTRNVDMLPKLDPKNLDRPAIIGLMRKYGNEPMLRLLDEDQVEPSETLPVAPYQLDEFAACGIRRPEDIRDLFVPNFYFGCEAEEPTNAWAFNSKVNPFGARLSAIFGSDIGHFDVPEISTVLAEAWELVADGLINQQDFRDFTFANPVEFWAANNPDFFKGTVVESAASKALAQK